MKKIKPLKKAPTLLGEGHSDAIGSDFSGTPDSKHVRGHVGSYKRKDGLFHHVIEDAHGANNHFLSTNEDPWDSKSSVARIDGTPSKDGFTIYHSSVRKDNAGKGLGKQLYLGVLAHHGDIVSDQALTRRSDKAWKALPELSGGLANVRFGDLMDKQSRHSASADRTKLQKLLYDKRIAPKKDKLAASEKDINKSKNVREQRKKVFGESGEPYSNSKKDTNFRHKQTEALSSLFERRYNMPLSESKGKFYALDRINRQRKKEGKIPLTIESAKKQKELETTPEGVLFSDEPKFRYKQQKANPKPDWRSGNLEAQRHIGAKTHEGAHLEQLPENLPMGEMQETMDRWTAEVGSKYKGAGKQTDYEVQPMALENKLRRRAGIPSFGRPQSIDPRIGYSSKPLTEDSPKRVTVDTGREFGTRIKQKDGKLVDLIAQSKNLAPEHQERLEQVDEGSLKFHPKKGWHKADSPNALINLRGRGKKEEATERLKNKYRFPKQEKLAASEKGNKNLKKGSLQSKLGNPKSNIEEEEAKLMRMWSEGENIERDSIPEAHPEAKQRFFQKLHTQTQVKKHPKTGERMFLLHRGVHPTREDYHKKNLSSWTPDKSIADAFAEDNSEIGTKSLTHSAWVPESAIHNYINNASTKENPQSGFRSEQEYIVKPHGFVYAKRKKIPKEKQIHNKISSKQGLSGDKSSYKAKDLKQINPRETHQGQFGWMPKEKLAASENININNTKKSIKKNYTDDSIKKSDKLDHYSHVQGLKQIDPNKARTGVDANKRANQFENKISFYYPSGYKDPEEVVTSRAKSKYTTQLKPDHKIFDSQVHGDDLFHQVKAENNGAFNMDRFMDKLKESGYHGFKTRPQGIEMVAMFHPLDVIHEEIFGDKEHSLKKSQFNKPKSYNVKINPKHGRAIADAYEQMKHDPDHPDVKAAYGALIDETKKQYHDMIGSGLKISKIKEGMENPYKSSKDMHRDIEENNHLWFFPTEQGYGSDNSTTNHPLLSPTDILHDNHPMLANDLLRVVHDFFGHYKGGKTGFGPKGEHQSYLAHKQMYSPLASKALATEMKGQNNWVNFSSKWGEHNRKNPSQTKYADQKAGLLPDHILNRDWHNE